MTSVHHLVLSQALQARAVRFPVSCAIGGNAPITVQIYALGTGVTLVRDSGNLRGTQGAFELEANGNRVVIDPLRSRKAEGFVAPVQGDVSAVNLSLQAIDKQELSQLRGGFSDRHGSAPSRAKAAILSLPEGWGKTTMARALAVSLGLDYIVEEWSPARGLLPGALHLTNEVVEEVQA